MLRSIEVDVYPRSDPERAVEIDGAIGEGSRFHETYGYYAHGVGPETIIAPAGWEDRLTKLTFPPIRRKGGAAITWCLALPDLLLAKLAAGRPHDLDFVEAAVASGLATGDELERGVALMPETVRQDVQARLEGILSKIARRN